MESGRVVSSGQGPRVPQEYRGSVNAPSASYAGGAPDSMTTTKGRLHDSYAGEELADVERDPDCLLCRMLPFGACDYHAAEGRREKMTERPEMRGGDVATLRDVRALRRGTHRFEQTLPRWVAEQLDSTPALDPGPDVNGLWYDRRDY